MKKKTTQMNWGRSGKSKRPSFLLISFSDSCDGATCTSRRSQRGQRMSEMPICLDMLSCDSIGLRDAAPLMDELSVRLSTLKAAPDLVTGRSLWPCQCPSRSHILTTDRFQSAENLLRNHIIASNPFLFFHTGLSRRLCQCWLILSCVSMIRFTTFLIYVM